MFDLLDISTQQKGRRIDLVRPRRMLVLGLGLVVLIAELHEVPRPESDAHYEHEYPVDPDQIMPWYATDAASGTISTAFGETAPAGPFKFAPGRGN